MVRDAYIVTGTSRTARVRMMNGGQVCLCPDFVFVPADRFDEFVADVEREFRHSFPAVLGNSEYCTIVDDRNYERIVGLVEDARSKGATVIEAAPPGETLPSAAERRIAPTILTGVTEDMRVMREEVFGPVLTVLPYQRLDDVIDYVNARPSASPLPVTAATAVEHANRQERQSMQAHAAMPVRRWNFKVKAGKR